MKVLCIGDSLSLPRDGLHYKHTWFSRLKEKYKWIDFSCVFERGLTTNKITRKLRKTINENIGPDVVVLQVGICDCAPRYVNKENLFWKIFFFLCGKWGGYNFVKFLFRKRRANVVYVKLKDFKRNIFNFVSLLNRTGKIQTLIIVKIGTPSLNISSRSPNLLENVHKYNTVFEEVACAYPNKVHIINPLCYDDEKFYVDGYHPNQYGHELVFYELDKIFANILV